MAGMKAKNIQNYNEDSDDNKDDDSYVSQKVESQEQDMGDLKGRTRGEFPNENGENIRIFKRISDIHSLNIKYFKEKPTSKDVSSEDVKELQLKLKKNELVILLLLLEIYIKRLNLKKRVRN